MIKLHPHQAKAVEEMFTGCILYGKVGSGKSFTSLFFYKKEYIDKPLYIITTAKKRDSKEWEDDLNVLGLTGIVDSWQNIAKYKDVKQAFFIFDEQRSSGNGKWGKSFIHIARNNFWVLLSGTPGDTWLDYMNIFIANHYYKNKTEFHLKHVVYDKYAKYPKINGFVDIPLLEQTRDKLVVTMPFERHTTRRQHYREVEFDEKLYMKTFKNRWDYTEGKPFENVTQLISKLRYIVNTDPTRIAMVGILAEACGTAIIFYNFNYERDILIEIFTRAGIDFAQWNGSKHEPLPTSEKWVYLVQYSAGAEGWNCTTTNNVIFYSMNYSYKTVEQCEGRIDRINTPYEKLNYYTLISNSPIDKTIKRALKTKTVFNERGWARKSGVKFEVRE